MTTAALTTLVMTGFTVGLLAQFLMVYYRLEQALQPGEPEQPQSVPLAYVGTGVIGAAGALSFVPLMMLLEYGRAGAFSSETLSTLSLEYLVISGLVAAANALVIGKALELGERRVRFGMLVAVSALWVFIALGVLLSRLV